MLTREEADRLAELRERIAGLSPRDAIVLHALCGEGLLNKAIAMRLDCSTRSVESIRARVYTAMGVETPAALGRLFGEWQTLDRISEPSREQRTPRQ